MRSDRRASHREVMRVVRRVRLRWRVRIAIRGMAIVLGAGLAGFLLSTFGLERMHFTPEAVIGFRVLLWLIVFGIAARFLVWPVFRRVSDERAALYLEEHEPTLETSVLAALDAGGDPDRGGGSFAAHVVTTALERARAVDYGRRVERPGLYRASGVLATLALAAVGLILFGPNQIRSGATALLLPTRDANSVNPYSVSVQPGDATIARGSDQIVNAELSGFESGVAQIFSRSEGASEFDRISMLPTEAGGFEVLLLGLEENTEYYVESEGIRSSTFRIEVADLPYVDELVLEYRFPAYTGLSPRIVEGRGDIAALGGTRVRVIVTPTMLTPGGQLIVGGEVIPLEPGENGNWEGTLTVREPTFYSITLQMADGTQVPASPEYAIDVLSDQPPSVSFSRPGRDTRASSIEEVFLEARADDDYGIADVQLVMSVNGAPEDTVSLFSAGSGRPMPEVTAGHTLYLEDHELESGDLITYYAIAHDNQQGSTGTEVVSDIYFLEVRPFNVDFRQAEQQGGPPGGGGGGQMPESALSELQKEVVAATFNVNRNRNQTDQADFRENVVSVRLAQARVREQVEALVERMMSRGLAEAEPQFQRIAAMLPEAIEDMKVAEAELADIDPQAALQPEQRALLKLQKAEETYERYVTEGQQQGGGGGGGGANAEDLADLFELELDRLKNQYETVQRGEQQQANQQVDETLEKLKELARRQQQEAERQRRRASAQQSSSQGGGSPGQRDLAEDAEEAARELQRLARETNDPELEQVARQIQEAADAMRRAAARSGNDGTAEANNAIDRLEEAQRRLRQNRSARLQEDTQDALDRAEDLIREQADVQSDLERLQTGKANDPVEEARRLFDRKEAMAGELKDLEQQLNRLSQDARQEEPGAADRLEEAAISIGDNKLKERVRYSRGLIQTRDAEYTKAFENETARGLEELRDRLERAEEALGESTEARDDEALDRTRDLVRGIESLGRRLEDRGRQGSQGDPQGPEAVEEGQQGDQQGQEGQQGDQQDQEGQEGQGQRGQGQQGGEARDGGQNQGSGRPQGGQAAGRPGARSFSPEDVRQFRGEVRERLQEARGLQQDLAREGIDTGELDSVIEALRALDAQRIYDDPAAVELLQAQVLEGLKQLEFGLRRRVEGQGPERASLSGSDDVPEGFRKLVEEYYKALSRGGDEGN